MVLEKVCVETRSIEDIKKRAVEIYSETINALIELDRLEEELEQIVRGR